MTISTVDQGEVLTVRTYKTYGGVAWANSYEIQALVQLNDPESELEFAANRFALLERALHGNFVQFDRVVISTFVPDGQPYNPLTFASYPINLSCLRNISPSTDIQQCLYVRRNVAFGRDGRLLYRFALARAEIEVPGIYPELSVGAQTEIQGIINDWFTQGGIGNAFRLVMARQTQNAIEIRPVNNLQVVKRVVVKQFNNRYFDRVRNQP